jgi:hypothetical protein
MSTAPSPSPGGEKRPFIALVIGGVLLLISSIAATGTLIVGLQQRRETARRLECSANMRQLGIAFHTYHDTMDEFPTEYGPRPAAPGMPPAPGGESLYVQILDFL